MAILAMVLDTLSGRTPLYRLAEFFEEKDTELLLGSAIEPDCFCDTNLGRAMDKIFETGTLKIFSQLAPNALSVFDVDARRVHFDTTSVSVYGDYDLTDPPFCTLTGWEQRPTRKPTSFMMTTKFAGIMVITMGKNRQLARPLKDFQREYLKAMGVTPEVFTVP